MVVSLITVAWSYVKLMLSCLARSYTPEHRTPQAIRLSCARKDGALFWYQHCRRCYRFGTLCAERYIASGSWRPGMPLPDINIVRPMLSSQSSVFDCPCQIAEPELSS